MQAGDTGKVLEQAAEIERLRAALTEIIRIKDDTLGPSRRQAAGRAGTV